jgi:hypothetical protein
VRSLRSCPKQLSESSRRSYQRKKRSSPKAERWRSGLSDSGIATGLDAPRDCEDEDNQEDQSNSANGIISPAAAVRPGGERSD